MESALAAAAAEPTWRDGLRAALYAIADFVEADERRTRLMLVEARTAGDRAIGLIQEGYDRFFDLIDRGREERPGAGSLTRASAEAIGGTIFLQMYAAQGTGVAGLARAAVPRMMYTAVLPYLGQQAAEEELRRPPHNPAGGERERTNPRCS